MNKDKVFNQFPQIETERLILKEIKPEHDKELFHFFSDREVLRYYDINPLKDLEESKKLIDLFTKNFNNEAGIRWGICLKEDGTIIGTCGYHNWSKGFLRAEVGYELSKEYWRKGIMSEVLKAIITYGFNKMELNRIEALVEPKNIASKEILKKIGFKEEGLLREYAFFRNELVDLVMLSILKREF